MVVEPVAFADEFFPEISDMGNRSAEGSAPQPKGGKEDLQ
jgi:hypothetical protein